MPEKGSGDDLAGATKFFQKPTGPQLPEIKKTSWPQTPIDFFVLAQLEAKHISPAPPADKATLIRRATFDLTGLPPSPQEVDTFLADSSPNAFAQIVDRLLASPRYGERWGRYWLDVARYADTKGYVYGDREETRFVHSYVYRDWVVRAFNEDLPYDQFLLQQIAADQLTTADHDSLAALGFLTLGRRFLGVIHDIIDDRIDVLMRGTQALTVGCARCHDHKFDPISTKDYYSLYGVFAACTERLVPLPLKAASCSSDPAFTKGLKDRVEKYDQTLSQKREEFSNRFRERAADYLTAVLDVKKLPTEEHYEIRGPNDLNPTVVRSWEAYLRQAANTDHPVFGVWHGLENLAPEDFATKASVVLDQFTTRVANPPAADFPVARIRVPATTRVNSLVVQTLREERIQSIRDVARCYGKLLSMAHHQWQENLRTAATNGASPPKALSDPNWEELRQVLYGSNSPVNIPVVAAVDLEWYFDEPTRVQLMKLNAEIERWIIKSPAAPPYSVVFEDRSSPKNPRVFIRGNPANKGEEVPRRFLKVLSHDTQSPFQQGSGRLELARAIANTNNPLTARVMVNRIWLHHFGAGLVRTPSDFGTRSEPPSHPQLLDWLACKFMRDGWSIKNLHRQIMLSSVYQQSSLETFKKDLLAHAKEGMHPALTNAETVDPENRLLWRMNRSRLDFEALRDSFFSVTGELDSKTGGPAIDLFKPPFSSRRTIYGFIDRQFLPATFRIFDFANPDMHSPQRAVTTVPQQGLFFMNSPFVIERARALSRRTDVARENDPAARIRQMYRAVYQRPPTSKQISEALDFLAAAASEPIFRAPPPPISTWRYGFGKYDESRQRITNFTELPHFTGEAWQGGANWPDEKLGWVRLTGDGGHAGNDLMHAAIRRWIAPTNMVVSLSGTIRHDHEEGDGVRARVVSNLSGSLGTWIVHKNKAETKIETIEMLPGDTLDFVVDFNANLNNDDFVWTVTIKQRSQSGGMPSGASPMEWNSKKGFAGPRVDPPQPLTPWEQFAQVLLLSNEFLFVD